jgi:hypothetical protein
MGFIILGEKGLYVEEWTRRGNGNGKLTNFMCNYENKNQKD